ncbi:hypothetical protein CPB85DRAFT_1330259 [Mucidula mucida]|nr:hypothetical protein CPB85DRAFT_1330259 [Mucidula mucida]
MHTILVSFSDEKEGHGWTISNLMHSVLKEHKSPARSSRNFTCVVSGNSLRIYFSVSFHELQSFASVAIRAGSRIKKRKPISDMQPVEGRRTRSLDSHGHCRSCFATFLCASACHPHVFEVDRRTERGILTIVLQFSFFERDSSCFLDMLMR